MSTTAAHPDRTELLQFAHEQLDADARAAVEQHLRRCAACRAFVESTPPPVPTPDAARAAAELDDVVFGLEPIEQTSATLVQPRIDVAAPPGSDDIARRVRRLRIVAGILAVLVILLLAATAWYVSSDNWNTSSESNADDTSVPITDLSSV